MGAYYCTSNHTAIRRKVSDLPTRNNIIPPYATQASNLVCGI